MAFRRLLLPTALGAFAIVVSALTACVTDHGVPGEATGTSRGGLAGDFVPIDATDPLPPPALSTVHVPEPSNLDEFVKDRNLALVLGKALFWETQVGSDGVQACASCHFHAGADSRSKNQLNPGLNRVHATGAPNPDYQTTRGLNYQLTAADFPFRKLANPDDRTSAVLRDTNDVVSSQGVSYREFLYVVPGVPVAVSLLASDPDRFEVGGVNVRRVPGRNTPSVINAVFNFRNFWDGRAQNEFNGQNPFGARDPNARVWRADSVSDAPVSVSVLLANSSLASQAMGPPVNSFEMSTDGQAFLDIGDKSMPPFRDVGKKLKSMRPLAKQTVNREDSVLGPHARTFGKGLIEAQYSDLIHAAFHDKWWNSPWRVRVNADGTRSVCTNCSLDSRTYALDEINFSLFFGIAVQMYEATLVSDDTPYDRWARGDKTALTDSQLRGVALFVSQRRGRCINCHAGAEMTNASVASVSAKRFRRREGNLIDMGFNNIGVRPVTDDLAVGGADPFGVPLSEARLAVQGQFVDPTNTQPPVVPEDVLGVDGAFKVAQLRNVELTAPYFHNGGMITLRDVIEFYGRGGDFVPIQSLDGKPISGLSTPRFTEEEKADLVAFLLSLTDERVRYRRAPFDHPEISVPNGHPGTTTYVQRKLLDLGTAVDSMRLVPAVGRNGGTPLPAFPAP